MDTRSGLFTRFDGLCLASVDGGLGAYKAAALLDVSTSYIYKASDRRRNIGDNGPNPNRGPPTVQTCGGTGGGACGSYRGPSGYHAGTVAGSARGRAPGVGFSFGDSICLIYSGFALADVSNGSFFGIL